MNKAIASIREEAAGFARAAFADGPRWVVFQRGDKIYTKRSPKSVAVAWCGWLGRNAGRYGIVRFWIQNYEEV